jgi:hypothetical protein
MVLALATALAAALSASAQLPAGGVGGPRPGAIMAGEIVWSPREAAYQQQLLAKTLDAVQPGQQGVRDVFILAAGLWGDPVFDREAEQAAEVLRARFKGTDGRVVVLANAEEPGRAKLAAATPMHVNAALGRIAAKMNMEEDVLILFLTSHGDTSGVGFRKEGRLMATMGPRALRASLDDAGVKNRVVIVSACHSGVFIPALSGANTVVLTAAAPDRKSFGCEPENDWTYFGDALFNQSLKRGRTLLQAFEEAKALISVWEVRDRLTPSMPQSTVAPEMAPVLKAIER